MEDLLLAATRARVESGIIAPHFWIKIIVQYECFTLMGLSKG